jgi:exosortase/archaeosortase family protein
MRLKISSDTYKKLLVPFSVIIMVLIVYIIDPLSLQETWEGRAFYLFFLWLFALEFILGSRNPKPKTNSSASWPRIIGGFFMLTIPTIYLILVGVVFSEKIGESSMSGLINTIIGFGKFLGVGRGWDVNTQSYLINLSFPLSLEYIIVAASILVGVLLLLDFDGIRQFSVSISLLWLIGVFFMINTFDPYTASFPNFLSLLSPILPQSGVSIQGFVPFISSIVASVMKRLGYSVQMVVLKDGTVQMLVNGYGFDIYWPCAGVYSLFIYTFVILLFLKGFPMSFGGKVVSFVIGAVGTFFVNILRIVSIMEIYVTKGATAGDIFHDYYGELFFMFWIVFYLFGLALVQRFLIRKTSTT